MEAAQGHWVLSSQEEHSCDSFAERIQTIKTTGGEDAAVFLDTLGSGEAFVDARIE
jgi:hypothetical protein